jgi:hypothetical protein
MLPVRDSSTLPSIVGLTQYSKSSNENPQIGCTLADFSKLRSRLHGVSGIPEGAGQVLYIVRIIRWYWDGDL